MDIRAEEISKIIRDQIGSYAVQVDVAEVGSVISLGDGIARVHGVERAMAGEMLEFPEGVFGIALNLEEDSVGAVLLGDYKEIKEGDPVKETGRIIEIQRDTFVVQCGKGTRLRVAAVQPEGRRAMDVSDFLNGIELRVGHRLG